MAGGGCTFCERSRGGKHPARVDAREAAALVGLVRHGLVPAFLKVGGVPTVFKDLRVRWVARVAVLGGTPDGLPEAVCERCQVDLAVLEEMLACPEPMERGICERSLWVLCEDQGRMLAGNVLRWAGKQLERADADLGAVRRAVEEVFERFTTAGAA